MFLKSIIQVLVLLELQVLLLKIKFSQLTAHGLFQMDMKLLKFADLKAFKRDVMDVFKNASKGNDMTDTINDELGDYFEKIKSSLSIYFKKSSVHGLNCVSIQVGGSSNIKNGIFDSFNLITE